MNYYVTDFSSKLRELDRIITDEKYMNLCNSNDNHRAIAPYVYLFRQYYHSVEILTDTQNSCAIYPLARSACECFASIYHLINTFEDPDKFKETINKEYKSNIKQLWRIYINIQDKSLKEILFDKIKKILIYIKAITGTENDSIIEDKAKSYNEPISEKVVNAFSHLPAYSSDKEAFNNLYPELCLYSHNNTDSIIERFFDNIDGKIMFNIGKKDKNIEPTKFMFIASADYLIDWLKKKI